MKQCVFWFVTGSQHLYGEETLKEVAKHSEEMVNYFNQREEIPFEIVWKPVVKTQGEITNLFKDASGDENCAGVITWMHTFSPSKMWINGLKQFKKPILHLHTQFNEEIPWDTMDMDFMNTNQSAHGDREHGFIFTRMGIARKVIAGHYKNETVIKRMARWLKVARAAYLGDEIKVMRLGDNMRDVAVTEGDKVEAEIKFDWSVDYYAVGDLVERMAQVTDAAIDEVMASYKERYEFADDVLADEAKYGAVRYQAKIEVALRAMLEEGGYNAVVDTFQDLHGLKQLPGLAIQNLMADGYGFGPEGDWKVAAMTKVMNIMADNKGTSLMEDYTYNLVPGQEGILGAHMLEVSPAIAASKPRIEVHPLGIGGKEAPARLVFDSKPGKAICVSLIDMGGRMRLIIADVDAIELPHQLPQLPVARAYWIPQPSMTEGTEAWIYAGGAHHTIFSYELTAEDLIDWAEMMDIEYVHINKDIHMTQFKKELQLSEILWKLK
ncbi:L-arabinose isomerase [Cellulosilyticum lentocellum]|uniref:L-arabinose isomerase n=1 Tax=Cellulosilyticum lentocellum (strain ATCC 49066 / DSM 5427 / NCIMB 11756 / RHM5) TaxID=642492 RepID=F2JLF2_CELLD|nr:L-arabinose isomerase [Cellulosilyticum lentocellum]ADZ82240.1 L-arabinose isomerase [Cellulosilyticum lentocellum DSM 5427]